MAVKKEFHTGALPSLEQATIMVVIDQGKKVVVGIEYNLVKKMPFYSKKSFLIRQPSLEKELGVPFKIKQKIKGNWEFVESVKWEN